MKSYLDTRDIECLIRLIEDFLCCEYVELFKRFFYFRHKVTPICGSEISEYSYRPHVIRIQI